MTERIRAPKVCDLCGEEFPRQRRRFCAACNPPGNEIRACPVCGERYSTPTANRRRYCSDACRDAKRLVPVEVCGHCGVVFPVTQKGQRWCSISCGQKGRPKPMRPCRECGEPFTAGSGRAELCLPCRRMVQRYHKRWVPDAVRRFVYERDGWVCQLCFQHVDPSLPGRHPMGATVDHIVCVSWGGDESPENLRLAHRVCNCTRSDEQVWMRRRAHMPR